MFHLSPPINSPMGQVTSSRIVLGRPYLLVFSGLILYIGNLSKHCTEIDIINYIDETET